MNIGKDVYNKAVQYLIEDTRKYVINSSMTDERKVNILNRLEYNDIPDHIVKEYIVNKINTIKLFEFFNFSKSNISTLSELIRSSYNRLLDGISNLVRTMSTGMDDNQFDTLKTNLYNYQSELQKIQSQIDSMLSELPRLDFGRIGYHTGIDSTDKYVSDYGKEMSKIISIFNDHVLQFRNFSHANISQLRSISDGIINIEMNRLAFFTSYIKLTDIVTDQTVNDNSLEILKSMDVKMISMYPQIKECRNILDSIISSAIAPANLKQNIQAGGVQGPPQPGLFDKVVNYLNPQNWNLKYVGMSAAVIGIGLAAYYAWKKWTNQSCTGLEGENLSKCRIKAIDKAIEKAKSELEKCDKSLSPAKCKKEIYELIKVWNSKKQDIYNEMSNKSDFE